MRKSVLLVAVLIGATLVLSRRPTAAAAPPAKEQFYCKLLISKSGAGSEGVVAQPTLSVIDGQEASFTAGGEVRVELGTPDETVPYGIEARIKVHRISDGKLRVYLYAGHSELDAKGKSEFTIRQSGMHVVRDVASGQGFTFDLNGGENVTATVDLIK